MGAFLKAVTLEYWAGELTAAEYKAAVLSAAKAASVFHRKLITWVSHVQEEIRTLEAQCEGNAPAKPAPTPSPTPPAAKGGAAAWKLVQTPCTGAGKTLVGLACFDSAGYASSFASVTASEASSPASLNGSGADFTDDYTVPETMPAGGAPLTLKAKVTQVTSPAHGGVCQAGIGDTEGLAVPVCAQTAETVNNGQTLTAEKTVTLEPGSGTAGTRLTLLIELAPAGTLYFTYEHE